MELVFKMMQAGRKKPILSDTPIDLPEVHSGCTLSFLLSHLVQQQVQAFTHRMEQGVLLPHLTADDIEAQLTKGKAGFQTVYNTTEVDTETAIQSALQAFEDGLYAVFVNDARIEQLTETLSLENGTQVMLIRLTFLAGQSF